MTEAEVQAVAEQVLRAELGGAGLDSVEVRPGLDHDGEASWFVTLHFRPHSGITGGVASTRAHAALRRRLLDLDEERFPYLRYHYPDDEVLVGDDRSSEA